MTVDNFDQKIFDKAKSAVSEFRKMCPQFSLYAQSLTGQRITVKPGKLSQTDGRTIFIRPPLSLAGYPQHEYSMCEIYDEEGVSLCEACSTREHLMVLIHHEIAHIAYGSFEKINAVKMKNQVRPVLMKHLPELESAYYNLNLTKDDPMIKLINLLGDRYLSYLLLFAEDIRINEASYRARPGSRKSAMIRERKIFDEGIERDDGTFTFWSDSPIEGQIGAACYAVASGHSVECRFDEDVVEITEDKTVAKILDKLPHAADVYEATTLTIELLARLRELGYLEHGEGDDELDELNKIIAIILGHTDDESNGSIILKKEDEDRLSKVLNAENYVDHIPVNIKGVEFFKRGEGKAYNGGYYGTDKNRSILSTNESILGQAVSEARIAFSNNARVKHHRNQKSGKLESKVLGRRAPVSDERLFAKKIRPDKRNYHVLIGLDISYSTFGNKIEMIKQAAFAQAEVCARTGVEFSIYAHSSEEGENVLNESDMSMAIFTVKDQKDPWDKVAKTALADLSAVSGNLDGHTIQAYRKKLDAVKATDKILMYYTDGAMPAANYDEELFVLQSEIVEFKKKGYTLMAVGVQTSSPTEHGLDTVRVDSPSDYIKVVNHLGKRIINGG